tara:strand:- start:1749 stop:2000 length:252 start_codon:yes stop_codon:yes gene_type:complete
MEQKFLIDTVKQNLDDIRDIILLDGSCCIPHKENGFYYADVETDDDGNEYMLCVTTIAETHLTQPQVDALLEVIPTNFLDSSI